MPGSRVFSYLLIALAVPAFATAQPASRETRFEILTPGPYWVGQAIPIRLVPNGGTPAVSRPNVQVPEAEVFPASDRHWEYTLVPLAAGSLTLGPLSVDVDGATLTVARHSLTVASTPSRDRPPTFLGGVGTLRAAASIAQRETTAGRWVEYALELSGPGAFGIARAPEIGPARPDGDAVEIAAIDAAFSPDTSTRRFRYRLRAARPGRWVVPAVSIATFQPSSQRYETVQAPSVSFEAAPRPLFDPGASSYGRLEPVDARFWYAASGVALTVCGAWVAARRWRAAHGFERRRQFAKALAGARLKLGSIAADLPPALLAARLDALATELARAANPASPAVASAAEALAFWQRFGAPDAGRAAAALVDRCAWFRCSERGRASTSLDDAKALRRQAAEFLDALSRAPIGPAQASPDGSAARAELHSSR